MRLITFSVVSFLLSLSVMCCSAGKTTTKEEQGKPPVKEVVCYEGDSEIIQPNGQKVPGGKILYQRTIEQFNRKIIERTVLFDARPNMQPRQFLVEMKVQDDGRFKFEEKNLVFSGDGKFKGESWKWTSWTSISLLRDGGRVESSYQITADGLEGAKKVFGIDDMLRTSVEEHLKKIDILECKTKFINLGH